MGDWFTAGWAYFDWFCIITRNFVYAEKFVVIGPLTVDPDNDGLRRRFKVVDVSLFMQNVNMRRTAKFVGKKVICTSGQQGCFWSHWFSAENSDGESCLHLHRAHVVV